LQGDCRGKMGFKALYWDLKDGAVRQDWQYEIVRNMPGRFGFLLRRKALQNRFKKAGQTMRIHKGCRIINIDKLEIGDSVHFGVDSYIQAGGGISIGSFTEMGPGTKIWSQTHIYDDPETPLENTGYEYSKVVIGKNVWIGAAAFIMPGVEIPDGCIVAACSVVGVKKWPKNSIIAGNPARKIGDRGKSRQQIKN